MSNVNFFTELSLLMQDKDSITLQIQKTKEELTILLVPKINGKTATITLCGSPDDLNQGFMEQLIIPVEKIKGLISNAAEAKIEDVEEEEREEEEEKKLETKKVAPKKISAKKVASKISEDAKQEIEPGIENPEGKTSEEIEKEIEEERIKQEEANKLAEIAEQEAKVKEACEAKVKEDFNEAIKLGDEAFEARKYEDAEKHYETASILMPDNKIAKEKFEKSQKWVKQLITAGIIVRKEEETHGA